MKNIKHLMSFFLICCLGACKEDVNGPLESNSNPPGSVSNVVVENLSGKAKISYSLPTDGDLLYVKAKYVLATGREMEVKSSFYGNSLIVEGFADTLEHEISLYTVNRSEVESPEPYRITIKPLEAPIWGVFKELDVLPTFGGIRVRAKNESRENVAILIMEKDEYGDWGINPNSIYTSTDSISYSLRGMDTLEREFAVTVRDRWLNYTDTLFTTISPLYETALPKSRYADYTLPGDAPRHASTPMSGMWDGEIMNWAAIYLTQAAFSGPHVLTFDVGVMAKMSRIVIWDYPEYYNGRSYYYLGNLKEFEVWGSDNPPSDGSFNNWVLLGSYNATKPSGLPFGQQNDEDYRIANAGFSWEFDDTAPRVRYLRIRSIRNWGGTTYMGVGEVQVYGDPR